MSIDNISARSVQSTSPLGSLEPGANADVETLTGLVVQSYKVEADMTAVGAAALVFEAYIGKLEAAEIRLATYANQKNPTEAGLQKIKAEVSELTSFLEEVHEGIRVALHTISDAYTAQGFGKGAAGMAWGSGADFRKVETTEKSWSFQGLQLKFDAESQLPVKPSAESIELHRSLIDKYKADLSAAEKTLVTGSNSTTVGPESIGLYVGWLKAEIGKTQVSLQQAEVKLGPWKELGLTAGAESTLPVRPNVESLRTHKEQMARYQQDLAAADKALDGMNKGLVSSLTPGEVRDRKNWLQAEIDRTHASLRTAQAVVGKDIVQSRNQDVQQLGQMKASYDALCQELSTINDNGVHRSQARAKELDAKITDLENSMGKVKASIELADAVIKGTYIPAR